MSVLSCPAVEHVAGRSLFPSRSRGWLDQPNVIDTGNLARANQSIVASLFQCPLERLQFSLPLGLGVVSLCRVGRHELKADGVEGHGPDRQIVVIATGRGEDTSLVAFRLEK